MKKESRRVRYTKQALKDSLLELLKEKPISKVTVSAICEKADINRSSFYLHYRDAYDLMERIEQELLREVDDALADTSLAMPNNDMVVRIFRTIYQNRELCSILFGPNGDRDFLARIISGQKERILDAWRHLIPGYDDRGLHYLYQYITFGAVGVVEMWVLDGYREQPESIARFLGTIIVSGLNKGEPDNLHLSWSGAASTPESIPKNTNHN